MRVALFVALAAAGCRTPSAPAAEPIPAAAPAPTPTVAPAAASHPQPNPEPHPEPQPEPLWSHEADLDGDGTPEAIGLTSNDVNPNVGRVGDDPRLNVKFTVCQEPCEGALHVGEQTHALKLRGDYFGGIGIRVIDVDASDKRKELLLVQHGGGSEDPPYLFWLALYDGETLRVHKLWNSFGYSSGTATPDGKGSLTLEYAECPDAFTVVYRLDGLEVVEGARKTKRIHKPDECAACPHVFVHDGDELVYKGEILRDLRGEANRGLQALSLGRHAGPVTVEIREDKPETSYIDHVFAKIDGVDVAPNECRTSKLAYCERDGIDAVLRPGESLLLTFPAPTGTIDLWAAGHYIPCYTCRP